ncbi:uncharacterized protein MELLADRAFT_60828 [Melampsora larici-populina 98AG31]|uniref:Blue (type 1) copper domain-containing protein n=1 Tax=Melampsora larici-populina (strain 98AG31 / pathotype 3-4-7) TaxID=747676 RepID=F4RCI0_MELLP|nr:uncharacterized protein MELLADRAFT_60828 [Melampsora larici-populina 98AG31]EGG09962.1 hypothetical protein MELLADRAFT_60828 [Melampsora larici-populina 98AG31]
MFRNAVRISFMIFPMMSVNFAAPQSPPKEVVFTAANTTKSAQNHVVQVGSPTGGDLFTPNVVEAKIGDTVTFVFKPGAHTVTQALFESPCKPATFGSGGEGFSSGLVPVKPNTPDSKLPKFVIRIKVNTPLWFFCDIPKHCNPGMVGAINPAKVGPQTFSAFQASAKENKGSLGVSKTTGSYAGVNTLSALKAFSSGGNADFQTR